MTDRHFSQSRELLFSLDEQPNALYTLTAALAHLLAMIASILAAPLLLAGILDLDSASTAYVINASLVVSGIATFIQVYRFGAVGSGLLAVQGTSFVFVSPMAYAASILPAGIPPHELMGTLLGTCAVGGFIVILASFYLDKFQRIITPAVTGTTIFLLGITLLIAALGNISNSFDKVDSTFRGIIVLEALITVAIIALLSTSKQPWLRLISMPAGLLIGTVVALLYNDLWQPVVASGEAIFLIVPLRFSLSFDPFILLLLLPIFLVSLTESIGDITATSIVSEQSIKGSTYVRRLRGGVMADGLNTVIASCLGAFPNTTFSQNNAVIRITRIASRRVGIALAGLLIIFGCIPFVGLLFMQIPSSVLYSAASCLFVLIALTGFSVVRNNTGIGGIVVLSIASLGAFLLQSISGLLSDAEVSVPTYLTIILNFPVATGAFIAIIADTVKRRVSVIEK
jgi:uracil-xanthine permease